MTTQFRTRTARPKSKYSKQVYISLGLFGFLIASAIAGQIIFYGQGDTAAISFRYGLLYLLYCGLPSAISGQPVFIIAVVCQFLFAGCVYWLATRRVLVAIVLLGSIVAIMCALLIIKAPQLFD